jgi:hypothetical protein
LFLFSSLARTSQKDGGDAPETTTHGVIQRRGTQSKLVERLARGRLMASRSCEAERPASPAVLLASGFSAGVCVAGVLNPVDRALFLSIAKRRPFLDPCNWRRPFQGIWQSLVGRAISSGLWFPLERLASQWIRETRLPPALAAAAAGQAAGLANACLLAPFSFVKFQTWG